MILAGDIGGTKISLGLFERRGGTVALVSEDTYASRTFTRCEDVLQAFVRDHAAADAIEVACCGVAGPVIGGRCHTTNLPWVLDEAVLAQHLGVRRVKLLNDGATTAYGMLCLRDEELVVLNPGATARLDANRAVLAAGTGLGESLLHWGETAYEPIAGEGGHGDFAPRTEQEIALFRWLRGRFDGHVSYERVIAGPGLFNIYRFLRDTAAGPEPAWLTERLQHDDPSAVISAAGLARTDDRCVDALNLFCSILGAEAGNLALRSMAIGGIYLAGGVPPKILPALQEGLFMAAFVDKGRFTELLQRTPVSVSLTPRASLIGAAHYALRL